MKVRFWQVSEELVCYPRPDTSQNLANVGFTGYIPSRGATTHSKANDNSDTSKRPDSYTSTQMCRWVWFRKR